MGQGSSVVMSFGLSHRHGLDPALLWLWCKPTAIALIQPLAWKLPNAVDVALNSEKKKSIVRFYNLIYIPSKILTKIEMFLRSKLFGLFYTCFLTLPSSI